jgi:hypothetical protein
VLNAEVKTLQFMDVKTGQPTNYFFRSALIPFLFVFNVLEESSRDLHCYSS